MKPLTSAVLALLVVAVVAALVLRERGIGESGETVTVVHWATGHLLRSTCNPECQSPTKSEGSLRLLPQMTKEFNDAGHRTASGKRIKVELYYGNGAIQKAELTSRINQATAINSRLPDPTLVTPSASHWLVDVNRATGREVVDLRDTESRSLARSYVGIVTFREMAECLGWPNNEIGYAEIIALRDDPQGWSSYPCAKPEWGERPLLAFTDPTQSDTGRAVLLLLYAIAAGKAPEDLTEADLERPEVVEYVRHFQTLVDHYQVYSTSVNSKIYQGPRWGHFFLMPEDNLIHLYDGTEDCFELGVEVQCPKLARPVVMIYPKEGSLLRENCACLVQADWVTDEQREAAEEWVKYLRADAQQRSIMEAGFRPGTDLAVADPISSKYGLNPATPKKVLHAERIQPSVAAAIDRSWVDVKKPGIVTWVIDTSGSMSGEKLAQAKEGMIRALGSIAPTNQVGFVSFSNVVGERIPIRPLTANKFVIANEVERLRAGGGTALYDAIAAAISLTDTAVGPPDAIRAVVVLTDGRANDGRMKLDGLIHMTSRNEVPIAGCRGFQDDEVCLDVTGRSVPMGEVIGSHVVYTTANPIQIFFIGIGDADLQIGRVLSEASGAEFLGVTEKDLAQVLEEFSKYF
jgi:Ca-activated chloride channel family protein